MAPSPSEPTAETPVRRAAQNFRQRFGRWPAAVAQAPGRVNLIGEHVDYEGYDVLPMALAHSVVVAAAARNGGDSDSDSDDNRVTTVSIANANDAVYDAIVVEVPLPREGEQMLLPWRLDTPKATWTNYVLCGILGVLEHINAAVHRSPMMVEMLVDGDIPAGCGLASSSALVVAAALAFASAVQPMALVAVPPRTELAEICRRAEQRVGTLGGGMDQTIACLAREGSALYISFATSTVIATPVALPLARLGLAFVVANSAVVAEKAVDAATQFNKRVVECALAAKVIGSGCGLDAWRQMSKLVHVQQALEKATGRPVEAGELLALAEAKCLQDAYTRADLESVLGVALDDLFFDSSAALNVIAKAASYRLRQRALHVWSEAERVREFRRACESNDDVSRLGQLMLESHCSLQQLYECSCPELDALVECAMEARAIGARLTGAGWGGCVVALVEKSSISDFTAQLKRSYYDKCGIPFGSATVFEVSPSRGAVLFETGEIDEKLQATDW